jgi:hypothetical protein
VSGVQIFNALEAAFWFALAALAGTMGHRTAGFTRRRQIVMTGLLAAFGVSDLWEIYSGAWWQPTSLLVLKAVCLCGLLATAGLVYRSRWRGQKCS